MNMKKILSLLPILLIIFSACAAKQSIIIPNNASLAEKAQLLSYKFFETRNRPRKMQIAEEGIRVSNLCIQNEPKNPACYYYRAVNTGQFYSIKVIGYQGGLKAMIKDCKKVLSIDPKFEYSGAYRIMGQIFTEIPEFSADPESLIRDLEKAINYLKISTEISPLYPENFISLANAYLKNDEKVLAAESLLKAKKSINNWKTHPDYQLWKEEVKKLDKKLKNEIKLLQSSE